jgi:hypothetical protein
VGKANTDLLRGNPLRWLSQEIQFGAARFPRLLALKLLHVLLLESPESSAALLEFLRQRHLDVSSDSLVGFVRCPRHHRFQVPLRKAIATRRDQSDEWPLGEDIITSVFFNICVIEWLIASIFFSWATSESSSNVTYS